MLNFYKLLFQLILSPIQGWNDVSHDGIAPKQLSALGFYPLLALASVSVFLQGIYHSGIGFITLFQECIIIFVKYFLTYFIALFFFSTYVYKFIDAEPSDKHNQTFIIMSLSLLALSTFVQNCIPMELDVVYLLSIYVAIIMWRGSRYMTVLREQTGKFMVFSIFTIIIPPYIINFLFEKII